jgi:Kef-type K+ transport system membrane component KefB/nucleotide-binding universal stress UspA family protein
MYLVTLSIHTLSLALQLSFDRPIDGRVAVFAFSIAIFLITPLILKQIELPGIIGILLAGVIVGPHALNLLSRGETIQLLGEVGLLYLIFISGLEIDLNEFIGNPTKSGIFAFITFSLPLVLGVASGVTFLGLSLAGAILFASIFSSHTILGYPVVERLNIATNDAITTAITGTILTDTLALLILSVIEHSHSQNDPISVTFWATFVFKLLIFFAGVWVIVPRVGRWFFRNVDEESYFEYLFTMTVLFVTAAIAPLAGAEPIIGAFLAGLTMNRLVPSTSTLMNRIGFVGDSFFIPFFMLSVGMLVQPSIFFQGLKPWLIVGTILGIMFGTKLVAAWATGHIYGFERSEWLTMFGLTTGQAAAALAVATIGRQLGLFGPVIVNATVLLILITGLVSPVLSERFGRQVVETEKEAEYEPSEAPERILVPVTEDTENQDLLLDLAMLVRGSDSEEPLHTLTVVRDEEQVSSNGGENVVKSWRSGENPHEVEQNGNEREPEDETEKQGDEQEGETEEDTEGNETEEEVAEAEETLEDTEEYAAGAEVPIETQTRVDNDTVNGIIRAIRENRITTVVMGWNNRQQFGRRLFGGTIEQLLSRTGESVLVASLNQPINTTERVMLVLPGRIAAHPGFYGGIHTVKRITEQLGVSLQCLLVNGSADQYEQLVDSVEPETPFEIETIDSWNQIRSEPGTRFEEGDLVIPLSPREGSRGWVSELDDLQRDLASVPGNLIMLYLTEDKTSREYLLQA